MCMAITAALLQYRTVLYRTGLPISLYANANADTQIYRTGSRW